MNRNQEKLIQLDNEIEDLDYARESLDELTQIIQNRTQCGWKHLRRLQNIVQDEIES